MKSEVLAPFKRFLSGSAPSDSVDGGGEVGGSYSVAKCASLCIGDAPSVDMSGMFRFVTSNAGVKSVEEGSRSSFTAQGLRKVRERDNEVRARTTLRVLLVLARTSLYNMHIIRIILRVRVVYYILLGV